MVHQTRFWIQAHSSLIVEYYCIFLWVWLKKIQLLRLLLKIGRRIHSQLIWGHNCFLCFFQILIMFNNIQGYWQGQSDMAIVVDSLFLLGGISRHTVAKHIHRHFCQNIHTPTHTCSVFNDHPLRASLWFLFLSYRIWQTHH